jgi:SAM-dependent methyltransferase
MGQSFRSEETRAFWERRYGRGPVYGVQPTSLAPRIAQVLRQHGVRRVLEAGCGSGRDALYYAACGFEVTGVDISPNALRWAERRAKALGVAATFVPDDLMQTRLAPASFDASLAVHLLHLHPAEARQRLAGQLRKVTRPAGLIVLVNYSTREAGVEAWEAHAERNTRIDPKGKLVHFFAADEFRKLLPPAGFEILTLEEVELSEAAESGPLTHQEWFTVARRIPA